MVFKSLPWLAFRQQWLKIIIFYRNIFFFLSQYRVRKCLVCNGPYRDITLLQRLTNIPTNLSLLNSYYYIQFHNDLT